MYYVYILESQIDHDLYVGYTDNLKKRIEEHNKGYVDSTRLRRPLKLIYYEAHSNRKDAMRREKFLKTGWGKNYIKRILANYFKKQR